ncbi:hypothetical protein BB560_003948 [Smittium megazygosporum]|uniref:AB hydrolase-1 domain-containing protein n=1 Tax=Smittium megazygosporum TaxID=133381 RepID=A0A2T9ZAL5_9FUNG|nr:hypothetical protein BB560_003948 [Smittium megazygosporum]
MQKEQIVFRIPKGVQIVANVFRLPGASNLLQQRPITLMFGHANSAHKELWDPIISNIIDKASETSSSNFYLEKIIAFDFSTMGDSAILNRDLLNNLDSEQMRPTTFKAIICVEPVLVSGLRFASDSTPISPMTLRRKNDFKSPDEIEKYFKSRTVYKPWHPDSLDIHIKHALYEEKSQDGLVYKLKCHPAIEAATYDGSFYACRLFWEKQHLIRCPLTLVTGNENSYLKHKDAINFVRPLCKGKYINIPRGGHMLPMEIPDELSSTIIQEIKTFLD